MNLRKLEKEVPFDQFSRQFQVAEIIKALKVDKAALTILDVGGYKGRTADFLPAEKVTVIDLYDVHEENYIKGNALDLPFEDASFDFVTSFDVLEHIPPKHREKFISECARVTRRGIIICAPNKTELNEIAERKLNNLYKKLHHTPHPWLKEHIEYGIPRFDLVEKMVQNYGYSTARFYSNKTQLWFAMQQAIFINSKFSLGAEKIVKLNEFYNQNFKYDGGGSEAFSYRQILCCLKNEAEIDNIRKKLGSFNRPIDPISELEIDEEINEYYVTIIDKTTQLANDYKELYEFKKGEISKYEDENRSLVERLSKYEKVPTVGILTKTKHKLKRVFQ